MTSIAFDSVADRGYAICTSPRSGSNLLCQILSSTGVLGRPLEYFNGPGRRAFTDPSFPDDPAAQVRWILTKGATPNGVYAVKLFAFQHDQIAGHFAWTTVLPRLKYVYLERDDPLGQALSWVRAVQSGQYRSTIPGEVQPTYDAALILNQLTEIIRERARWSMFFARTGIAPEVLTYDTVVSDPQSAVDRVAGLVGISEHAVYDPSRADLAVQRDETTAQWRHRFIAEHGNPDFVDPL
jgi:LPS sulfotransferase NodH